jgi:hypothetical protein
MLMYLFYSYGIESSLLITGIIGSQQFLILGQHLVEWVDWANPAHI